MAIDPDGRIFFIERPGHVRLVADGVLQPEPVMSFKVDTCNERGLLGLTLDPDFASNHFVYVLYIDFADCADTQSKVVRIVERGGIGSDQQEIFSAPHSGQYHSGNSVAFGPDRKLYISVGDNFDAANAQNAAIPNGKIHRINPDGSIPSDNPVFPQTGAMSSVFAMGLRNTFDFTFDSVVRGRIFGSDNGPNCDDELNRIEAGFNYGWRADYPCDDSSPDSTFNTIPPIWHLSTEECCIGPTGVEIYSGSRVVEWKDHLFMCSYNEGAFLHFYLDESRTGITKVARVSGVSCGMDVLTGPDGALYYIESGGGNPGAIRRITGSAP
jgi:glucose/arabinose dehydrogenase